MRKNLTYYFIFLCTLLSTSISAQKKDIFLFDNFSQATIIMKNKARLQVPLNYDISNQQMKFKQNDDLFIVTNLNEIDTIYFDSKKFIPYKNRFVEVCTDPQVQIDWKIKEIYIGKKGAYGQVTQAKVEVINTNHFQNGPYENQSAEINRIVFQNQYIIHKNEKTIIVKNEKQILKTFPEYSDTIKNYIKKEKIDCNDPKHMIQLISYCMNL